MKYNNSQKKRNRKKWKIMYILIKQMKIYKISNNTWMNQKIDL